MSVRRLQGHAAGGLVALMLAACGSPPKAPADPAPEPVRPAAKTPVKKPAVTLKRGGGYYKDDGPADDLPDGLDDVPDAEPAAAKKPPAASLLGKGRAPKRHRRAL